jgi:class 3 adenylate cyclase/pimeloyl-ACP methyl ester carboxylesterase
MAEIRIGTITFLFTDLERSTEILQRLGDDEAQRLWRTHFRLLRNAVAVGGGQEVKSLGDGLMVAFASALDALACAVAMQQTVHRHNEHDDESHSLQVRVGLHAGEPISQEDDYFGMPVVIAKRLCDRAQGGQILASELVRGLVGSRGGHTFRDLGPLLLKGTGAPVSAHEVEWEPIAEEPPATLPAPVEEPASPLPLPPLLAFGERTAFVGRRQELEHLLHQWERVRAGQRRLVLLRGGPGIGKTRLAAEFALAAHAEGGIVLFGRSDERATLYQPFVEALRHYIAACPPDELRARLGTTGADLIRAMPEIAQRLPDLPVPPPVEPETERQRLYDAFAALLAMASGATPTLLILDDLHLADEATLQLLKGIVREPEASPLLVLATYRDTEVGWSHPLAAALADLRRDRRFHLVSLDGLDKGNVGELVGTWIGLDAPPEFIRTIHELTEGNPFFIEELLRHLEEMGTFSKREGRLTTALSIDEMGIPEGVKEVVGQRLSRLSEECNSILTIASVIGREFDLDSLERVSHLSIDRLLELLEEAVGARVVAEVPNVVGRYSFSHALMHETLYDELTTTRRVRLHGQTLRYADSEGVKLAYEVLGASGPFVVALGLSNCPAIRPRNRRLARHWDRVSRHCRLILYDRRGVGFSEAPEQGYSVQDSVDDLCAVLDAVDAERVVVFGPTDGGPLAISLAAQHPERVSGLILLGTSAKLLNWGDFQLGINPTVAQSFVRLDAVDQSRAVSELTHARPGGVIGEAEAVGEVMGHVPRAAWSKILGVLAAADARSLLGEVRAPTLIIHDEGNSYIPVEAAYYLHENISGSELMVTEEYGAPPFGEAVYQEMGSFIEKASAGGA